MLKVVGGPGVDRIEVLEQIEADGGSPWLDFIDRLALLLGLVTYNTEGEYMGSSSAEPSHRM